MKLLLQSLIASLVLSATALSALAQSTAFTYQGVLSSGNQLASGLHDFRFRLFDASSGGTQIGPRLCIDNVQVTGGKFTATLDFGQQFDTRQPRFLELETRADSGLDCTNASGFLVTGPRHLLTGAPLAIHADVAFALDAPDGSPVGAVLVHDSGRVGIGTTNPLSSLHIRQSDPALVLQDPGSDSTQAGYLGFWNVEGAETGWIGFGSPGSPVFSIANARASGHISFLPGASGNAGIDTTAPLAKLEVRGDIRMGSTGQQFALRADENLKILRGAVDSQGVRLRGSGFTSSLVELGKYRIDYPGQFSDTPAIVVTGHRSPAVFASLESVGPSSAIFVTYWTFHESFANCDSEILIVGPR